jgi:hypothetical protein
MKQISLRSTIHSQGCVALSVRVDARRKSLNG